jgi:hypothetical protein
VFLVNISVISLLPAVVAGLSTLEYMTTHGGRRVLGSQSTKNLIHLMSTVKLKKLILIQ